MDVGVDVVTTGVRAQDGGSWEASGEAALLIVQAGGRARYGSRVYVSKKHWMALCTSRRD